MTNRETIETNMMCMIERVDFDKNQVAVKSYNWKYSKESLEFFLNEIVTFQIIQERIKDTTLKEAKETLKCPYIAEYLGFMLYDSAEPFYGSIVLKWYPMGDLCSFTRRLSNPKWFLKPDETSENNIDVFQFEKKCEEMPKEIDLLIELARQIAEGFFEKIMLFFLFHVIYSMFL